MIDLNVKFQERYKELDALCKDIFSCSEGITAYISTMENSCARFSRYVSDWNLIYRQLKCMRSKRNKLAHEVGAFESDLCTEYDIDFLVNFYNSILNRKDPLAIANKAERENKERLKKLNNNSIITKSNKKESLLGIYFSGTGNTKHCVTRFVGAIDNTAQVMPIENRETVSIIESQDVIIFGYPVYYSNLPKIVRDFIVDNKSLWQGKKVFIIATMGLFSGDGAGCSARLFKRYGATVLGGLHIKMPDCIGDVKLLKKSADEERETIMKANAKIDIVAEKFKAGKYPKEGLNFLYRLAGLFGQRLYFPNKTKDYYKKIKTDDEKCVKCGLCVSLCPMLNIEIKDGKIAYRDKCTMCYRCFSNCPKQAITIIGKNVYTQCKFENFQSE